MAARVAGRAMTVRGVEDARVAGVVAGVAHVLGACAWFVAAGAFAGSALGAGARAAAETARGTWRAARALSATTTTAFALARDDGDGDEKTVKGSVANVRGRREAGVRGRARANGEGGERASGGARERGGGVVRRVRDGAGLGARVARVAEQRVARDRDRTPRRGVRGVRVRRLGGCFGARSASRGDDDEGEGVSTTVAKCD